VRTERIKTDVLCKADRNGNKQAIPILEAMKLTTVYKERKRILKVAKDPDLVCAPEIAARV